MKWLRLVRLVLLLCFGFFMLFNSYQLVKADEAITTNSDFEYAISHTPNGLHWNNDDFTIANFSTAFSNRKYNGTDLGNSSNKTVLSKNPSRINNAKIIPSTNPKHPDTSIIQMTNAKHQTGAVWSNMSKDNYFDLDHEQTVSMWLYFGRINDKDPGDGMAFILQNDPNGGDSIALSKDGIPVNGESMGVWGADWNPSNVSPTNLSLTAIQNSWALEFDTFPNRSNGDNVGLTGEGTIFDAFSGSTHIAANYPADPDTYVKGTNNMNQNYFTLSHKSVSKIKAGFGLVDGLWNHLTISWNPSNNILKYSYKDKSAVTGAPLSNPISNSQEIDTTKFGLTNGNKKLYWGFTGSTGDYSENNLIVFESLPSFVDAKVDSTIYDNSKGIQIDATHNIVDSNSDITYSFSLNYKGWEKDWNKINASLKIPEHITFTSGTVTYPNSSINTSTRQIPADYFKDNTNRTFQYQLPEKLDSHSRDAKIELHGKVDRINSGETNVPVPSVHASFEGDNLITGTETPSFSIEPLQLTLDSFSPNPIILKHNQDTTIDGQVTCKGLDADYNQMKVHLVLIDSADLTNPKRIIIDKPIRIDPSGKFTFGIDASILKQINNSNFGNLEFYVTYGDLTSNHINRQLSIGGLLAFGKVQTEVNFQTTIGFLGEQIVPRSGNWQVEVNDSRKKGSPWKVTAESESLTHNNQKTILKGNMFYRDPQKKNSDKNIQGNPTIVASHIKDVDTPEKTNITNTWDSNSGILLAMQSDNLIGTYNGKIYWALSDSI